MSNDGTYKLEKPRVDALRLALVGALGEYLAAQLEQKGLSEETLQQEFEAFRRSHFRRNASHPKTFRDSGISNPRFGDQ